MPNIHPYLDPGSGSLLLQLFVTAIVSIGLFFSISWRWIKSSILHIKTIDDDQPTDEEDN